MSGDGVTWGVDPSVNYPVLAEWPSGRVEMLHTQLTGPARLADLLAQWTDLVHRWYTPELRAVFVERVRGKFPKDALVMACGVIEAATHTVLAELEADAGVFELSTPEWKAHGVGKGNATKAVVMRWAKDNGYAGDRQDEADALAIACAGGRILRKGEQAALDEAPVPPNSVGTVPGSPVPEGGLFD